MRTITVVIANSVNPIIVRGGLRPLQHFTSDGKTLTEENGVVYHKQEK